MSGSFFVLRSYRIMTLQATDMTFYFLNFEHETVEIVELRIFGGCAVVKGRKGNMRAAKRQGLDLEYQVVQKKFVV